MLQPLGGHRKGDRITVGQKNAHGWVEIAANLVDDYVAAQYIKVVS